MTSDGNGGAAQVPLTPEDLEEICEALIEGYTVRELKSRLLFKWGLDLDRKLNPDAPAGSEEVFRWLVQYTQRQSRTRDLLGLAWSGNPGNDFLNAAAQRLIPDRDAVLDLYSGQKLPAAPANLEAVVNQRSRTINYDEFLAKYEVLGKAICRIETPVTKGTGFLIGKRTVLTNYHVVEGVVGDAAFGKQVTCYFDYHGLGEGEEGTPLLLAENWLGPRSRYAESDLTGTGTPSEGELDFAVLYLAEAPVDRPSLPLTSEPRIVMPGDVAMIAQHPGGAQLAIAYGVVEEFPANGLRYRYDCTTEPGASGAPMMTADLNLVGLHHAADPNSQPKYNQAIPTHLIARAIAADGLDLGSL